MRLLTLALLVALQSCINKKHALIEGIAQGENERLILEKKAKENKDPLSASKLAQHYLLVERNEYQARYWFKMAAKLGGERERASYESFKEASEEQ
ncbi:MAG TPA: hypothetical protein VGE29_15375 [Prosthecobacter sp.]